MEESENQPFFSKGTREKAAAMLKPICAMGQPPNMVELGVSSSSKWAENAVVDHRIMKLLTVQMLGRGQPASLPSVTPQKDTRSMPCCMPRVSKLHGFQRQSLARTVKMVLADSTDWSSLPWEGRDPPRSRQLWGRCFPLHCMLLWWS